MLLAIFAFYYLFYPFVGSLFLAVSYQAHSSLVLAEALQWRLVWFWHMSSLKEKVALS